MCWNQILFAFVLFFLDLPGGHQIAIKTTTDYIIEPMYYNAIPGEVETIADYKHWNFRNHKRVLLLEGNYTFTKDMDNTYVRQLDSYYSPRGNNKFEKLPFRLPEAGMCDYYNTSYRKYIEPHFIGKTNFPTLPPEGICPIPKGNYWAKGVVIREDVLPIHIPRGVWRLSERFYLTKPKRTMVGGLDVFARIHDKYG